MRERVLKGWTFTRVLYLVMGIVIVIQSFTGRQWMGLVPGAYLASMGIFGFACAAGNCSGVACSTREKTGEPDKI